MASFRTGFKIFGEISLKQGLGRIRSFSEDRKPGQWLPEDQWAVRHPGSTCPDPYEKPKKPPKPSKSWLSICRDPPKPIECDVRHNNCPPVETKDESPWYSLDNFIPKKKHQEKTPPLQSCREEMRRRELYGEEEEVCEKMQDKTFPENIPPEPSDCCMPKSEPCPAPVVTLSCPLPKELDITLWCERPNTDTSRIPIQCQSDKLPYEEFRPQKSWKPPPFSLPLRSDPPSPFLSGRCPDTVPYAEFKQVDVPRPLYTRYKSVELIDKNMLFCMTNVKCDDENDRHLGIEEALPAPLDFLPALPEEETEKKDVCPEKPVITAASCKPFRLKKAPKYKFRPKPTKLVERPVRKDPYSPNKTSDLCRAPTEEIDEAICTPLKEKESDPPKVITGTLTDEPQTFEREAPLQVTPPKWMYAICKPGAKKTPLVPCKDEPVKEPDNCSETDGLKFYDGNDECITPKPPPDPCIALEEDSAEPAPVECEPVPAQEIPCPIVKNRFVLMPEEYNIKYSREAEDLRMVDESHSSAFEKFIEVKTASSQKFSKSYPPMKENILYDLQRLCPNPPLDPSKLNAPCRKPPQPACPRFPRFYRSFSTLQPSPLRKLRSFQLCKIPHRTECEDTSGKCKARKLIPRPKPCPEPVPKPECAEITLPCCPKARIPPDCDFKRPMPICKKKLPPKPSFSECSKDPPPCPRNTECDCWEKKAGGKKGK